MTSRLPFVAALLLLVACQSGASLGATCEHASDCSSALVCRLGRCRSACAANRDCPLGAQCFLDANGNGACQLDQDRSCGSATACGTGLDCLHGACVRACTGASECASDGTCAIASGASIGVCVDPRGGDAGVGDASAADVGAIDGGTADVGASCALLHATAVCASYTTACAVAADTSVVCWGSTPSYAPVFGTASTSAPRPVAIPLLVGGMLTGAISVACGNGFACAVLTDHSIRCWGDQGYGHLGSNDGGTGPHGAVEPMLASGALPPTLALALGDRHACALSMTNDVNCWGENDDGQLGIGTTSMQSLPVPATALMALAPRSILAIGASSSTTCIALGGTTTDVRCLGGNGGGVAGADPSLVMRSTSLVTVPNATVDPAGAFLIGGDGGFCAIDAARHVACWGNDNAGFLGRGTFMDDWMAQDVLAGPITSRTVTTMLGGVASLQRCAVTAGQLYCWGDDASGALSFDPTGTSNAASPTLAPLLADVTSGACGEDFCCGIRSDGILECWGKNDGAQLGRGAVGAADFHPAPVCAP
jgi:hypothetical protein